jgi:hypothetical protein
MFTEANRKNTRGNADSPVPGDRKGRRKAIPTNRIESGGLQVGRLVANAHDIAIGIHKPSPFVDPRTGKCVLKLKEKRDWYLTDHGHTFVGLGANSLLVLRECQLRGTFEVSATEIDCGHWPGRIICAGDDRVWVFTEGGSRVTKVGPGDCSRRSTKSLEHLFGREEELTSVVVLPGTQRAWIDTSFGASDHESITRLVDLEEGHVLIAFRGLGGGDLVVGSNPHKILRGRFTQDSHIWSADGRSSIQLEGTPGMAIGGLTAGFWGEGFLAFRHLADNDQRGMELVVFDALGRLQSRTELPDCEQVEDMITFPAEGHTLVRTHVLGAESGRLLWLRHGDHEMVLEAVHSVPNSVVFIQDPSSCAAAYVVPNKEGCWIGAVDPVHGIDAKRVISHRLQKVSERAGTRTP